MLSADVAGGNVGICGGSGCSVDIVLEDGHDDVCPDNGGKLSRVDTGCFSKLVSVVWLMFDGCDDSERPDVDEAGECVF